VIDRLGEWRTVEEHTLDGADERMIFKLPRQLTE
jgi:4-hydroxy-3-methylbut-2-enyl diphosphate reductase